MENTFKRAISLVMTLLMIFSTVACLSGVSLAADTVTEKEPNDGSNTATLIPVDTLCNGSLSDEECADWYKFTTEGDYFNLEFVVDSEIVDLSKVEEGWNIAVYPSDSATPIREYIGVKEGFVSANLAFEGTYYIKVTANADYNPYLAPIGCIYGLKIHTSTDEKWESESNHSSDTANVVTTDVTHYGTLYSGTDVDWYKFTNIKDYFTFSFKLNETVNYSEVEDGWNIYFYLKDGVTLIKAYEDVTENFVTPELPFSGEILVKIVASNEYYMYAPIDCYYDFKITTVSNPAWESEANDTSADANYINTGSLYYGSLYKSQDIDWYVFEANTGAFNIEIAPNSDVDTPKLESGWTVSVYPYGSSEAICTYEEITANFKSADLPFKGKYTVSVKATNDYYAYAPTDCTYKLKVITHNSNELWEREKNNTAETATNISLNSTYKANLYTNADNDYFTFTSANNGCCEFVFKRDVSDSIGSGWAIKVIGSKSGEVFNGEMGVNGQTYTAKFSVKKGEKYTVCINASNTYYSPVAVNYTVKATIKSHSYTSKVTQAATYKSTGVKTFICKNCGHTYSETIARKTLKAVSNLKATPSTTSVKFTWSKVTGAEKYEVYYSTNGKSWKKVTATKNSVTIKKLKAGTTYKVKVRAVAGKNKGSYSSVLTTATKPAKVTLSKLTAGSKKLTATWKTVSGATGYEVQYSTSKKFTKKTTKTVTIKKAKTKKTTIKKLKKSKKYYVKVRAYKTVSGKNIYGAWSAVKNIKVK